MSGEYVKGLSCLSEIEWEAIRSPGLTVSQEKLRQEAVNLKLSCDLLAFKYSRDCLWIALMGGTGTGKSTLFNALIGSNVSSVGVARPTTMHPVGYGHRNHDPGEDFPVPLQYNDHDEDHLSHLVLLDTPDLDSLEPTNRHYAEVMYRLSQGIVFVASQEKYADDILFQFMKRAINEGKPLFILFNKAEPGLNRNEIAGMFKEWGLDLEEDRYFVLPFLKSSDRDGAPLREAVAAFRQTLLEYFSPEEMLDIKERDFLRTRRNLSDMTEGLLSHIDGEEKAAREWIEKLDLLVDASVKLLSEEMKSRHEQKNLDSLKKEIKKIFGAYDLLAKPRRHIASLIQMPFDLLGFRRPETPDEKQEELLRVRNRVDISPILAAMERMNILVLENMSPSRRDAALFGTLREEGAALTGAETEALLLDLQTRIALWLKDTITELERDLPKGKKVGIYSTSVIWGAAILSFETVLGGGITLLEMAFNTVLAPFITKSSADLFAHRELKVIIEDMNNRYREGIASIFRQQRDRYVKIVEDQLTPEQVRSGLQHLKRNLEEGL